MLSTYCFAKCKKVQQGYASLLVLLADGAIVFARGTTLCSWWNHSSSGACSCFLPRKMVWSASWGYDRLLQQDPSQRIATKCHICHFREGEPEYSSSKFGVRWKQGNRKSLQKDIVDFVFYNCNIISNSSMQKIIRTSLEEYIGIYLMEKAAKQGHFLEKRKYFLALLCRFCTEWLRGRTGKRSDCHVRSILPCQEMLMYCCRFLEPCVYQDKNKE